MKLSEAKQCLCAASLRHQLRPGRLRYPEPTARLAVAYMLDAPEWAEPWESPVCRAAVRGDGALVLQFYSGTVMVIAGGRAWLDRVVADVTARAELGAGSEDAEYLRAWPRVSDYRL